MICVYYSNYTLFELDYIRNDIFYNYETRFIKLEDHVQDATLNNEKNVLLLHPDFTKECIKMLISILKPRLIFYLSDEFRYGVSHLELFKTNCFVFHQYMYSTNHFFQQEVLLDFCFQIPLGYVCGFVNGSSFGRLSPKEYFSESNRKSFPIKQWKYDFCFIGSLKNERSRLIQVFSRHFRESFVHTGITNWKECKNQPIPPRQMFEYYSKSLFVLIGRGNYSYNCFRIYEAIVANAIPVLCGQEEEIKMDLFFNGECFYYIFGKDEYECAREAKKVYRNPEKIAFILQYNYSWWHKIHLKIHERLEQYL